MYLSNPKEVPSLIIVLLQPTLIDRIPHEVDGSDLLIPFDPLKLPSMEITTGSHICAQVRFYGGAGYVEDIY